MAYGSTSYVEVLKSLHLVPFCHTTMHTPDFLRALYLFTPNKQMHNYTPTRQTNTTAFHLYLPCLPFSVAIKLHHNHSPCTSTCTTHPPLNCLPPPPPHTTNTRVKLAKWCGSVVVSYHSHLLWLIFESSIPTCACFHSEQLL